MGKYMGRNSNTLGDVSIMNGGVRTRAKTLALQNDTVSYIQLRSRRLLKLAATKRHRIQPKMNKDSAAAASQKDLGVDTEASSIGENIDEIDIKERSARETTPCNLIRSPDTITTPGSSSKRTYSTNVNHHVQNSAPSRIPATVEMEEFFTEPEKQQQQLFIEKYNFDPVKEKPLPGRFEWVKVDGTRNVN
uniref:cyclin-dependent kinase inhibitor 4-like isoform X2 n=1 Tax=Erigeron canadensis TaxID=72917 RepID=UPI001CB8CE6E|nr:cyclin-dependent kinase inhibitor 4-like isoform X2 [Erigeron canadensis]